MEVKWNDFVPEPKVFRQLFFFKNWLHMCFQELALALIRWKNKNRDSCIETKKHLIDDSDRNKKENDTKMCVITREL